MGSRGAFVNADEGNFTFKRGGQAYHTIEKHKGYEVIEKTEGHKHDAIPYYSHSKNAVYVILKNGKINSIMSFDGEHKRGITIDFAHEHGTNHVAPHVHYGYEHDKYEEGTPPNEQWQAFINRVLEETGLELDYPKYHFKKRSKKR